MDKKELLDAFEQEDRADYGRRYLLPYWKEHAGQAGNALLGGNFELNHLGTLSKSATAKAAARRSGNAVRNFTSTTMPPDSIRTITSYLQRYAIGQHVAAGLPFRNYQLGLAVASVTVAVDAEKGGGTQKQEWIFPVVGINQQGLINHFHGSAEYHGDGVFVINQNGDWMKKAA